MADSPHDAELHAALGLHRGRRALGAFLLVVVALAGVVFMPHREPAEPSAAPVVAPQVAPVPASAKPPRPTRARAQKPAPKREVPQVVAKSAPTPAAAAAPVAAVEPAPRVETSDPAPPPPPPEPEPEPGPEAELAAEPASEPQEAPTEQPAAELQLSGNGEAIARAIAAAKRAAVRDCFERELKQQPKLTGTVVVELDLAPPNRLEGVRVSDDLERPAFTRCVTATMQGVHFAGLDEELSVSVPYVLSPERR